MFSYIRSASIVSLLLTIAAMMCLPDYFWAFVILVYAAIVIWCFDLLFDERIQAQRQFVRVIIVCCATGIAVWFTLDFVLAEVPLTLSTRNINSTHQAGTSLGGISWSPKYSDLRIVLDNPTDYDFSDVDLILKPDGPVVAMG